jgi:hypothetical protein
MAIRSSSSLAFVGAAALMLCFSFAFAESLSHGSIDDELQVRTLV